MRVRIESDGATTRVYDVETGRELSGLAAVRWEHKDAPQPAAAQVEVCIVEGSFEAEAAWFCADPELLGGTPKQIRRIEFADGSTFEP